MKKLDYGSSGGSYTVLALKEIEPLIVMIVRSNSVVGMEGDDLAQELRFHLWNKIGKYHPEKAGLRTWARQVIKNFIIDRQIPGKLKRDSLDINCTLVGKFLF